MVDIPLLQRIIKAADLNKTDTVIEIGPGTGNLTVYLQKIGKKVYVIEKDKLLEKSLEERFQHCKNISFIYADAIHTKFPPFNKCVSNLPYTICEPLLWKMTRYEYECLVLVVPKKFTDLLLGNKSSRLKLLADAFFNLELLEIVPPEAFEPPPKVYSALIKITPKKDGNFFLREFFIQYDKRTKNALREIFMKSGLTKTEATEQVLLTIPEHIQNKNIVNLSLEEIKIIAKGFLSKE